MLKLSPCPHRGRIITSAGKCFCRYHGDANLVSFDQCNACPLIGLAPPAAEVQNKSRLPIGDWIAGGLEKVGITKQRVSKVAGGDCGCSHRQEKLNEIGNKIAERLS